MNKATKVAFVALKTFPLLAKRPGLRHVGGAETQQVAIAKWLQRQGYSIDFVTLDHGQRDGEVHDGITTHKAYAVDRGLPVVRAVYPRAMKLWAAMKRSSADVFCQWGAGTETALVAHWCRRNGRSFVFSVAADTDCIYQLPALTKRRERHLFRWGIRQATRVVVQTQKQQQLLRSEFDIESTIVRNCRHEVPSSVALAAPSDTRPHVLWVGRQTWEKRFEWLVELAERCPDIHFDVVGRFESPGASGNAELQRANDAENVSLHGFVSPEQLDDLYRNSAALCCTSVSEGFPNTFLEAWSYGVPVATTFDPDGVVRKFGLGWTADTLEQLVATLQRELSAQATRSLAGAAARDYYLEHHTPDRCLPRLTHVIDDSLNESHTLDRYNDHG